MRARVPAETSHVFRGDELAGVLSRTQDGSAFRYDDAYLARHTTALDGVAYALPPSPHPVVTRGTNVHPFFAGLLPEGARLDALLAHVKTSKDDLFGLLLACGGDAVGDVSVVRAGERPADTAHDVDVAALETESFADVLAASLARTGTRDGPVSIAGVQPKVSAAMISLPIRARKGRASYLLKLAPSSYPHLVENEAFFMATARAVGIDAAETRLVRDANGVAGLLVERFDRIPRGAREPAARVHQEDGCQLLGLYPADKYNVSTSDLARALAITTAPIVSVSRLLTLVAFSYAIANGDLHARNVSVRTSPKTGLLELTPVYDLVCTLPYGDTHLALPLDGRDKNLRRKHFVAFGERFGVRAAATNASLDALVVKVSPFVDRIDEIGFDTRTTSHVQRTIRSRLAALAD